MYFPYSYLDSYFCIFIKRKDFFIKKLNNLIII